MPGTDSRKSNWLLPAYMYEKGNVVRLVLLTALFALLFLNIYQPFNSGSWASTWEKGGSFIYLVYSSLVILVGMGVIALSRMLLYQYGKRHDISYLRFAVWVLVEMAVMALIYSLFQVLVLERYDKVDVMQRCFTAWGSGVKKTALVLLIPYTIAWLYFALKESRRQLASIGEIDPSQPEQEAGPRREMLSFCDEKGELKFSVDKACLYYVESADNYVKLYYMSMGKMHHYLLRNSLKNIEETFADKGLVRCNRSCVVNFDKVSILRKGDEGLCLDLDNEFAPNIPVTRSYSARVMDRFSPVSQS